MDDELEEPRREVAVLRRLVAFALPYVPLRAGSPEIQVELDRAVFGADFLERVGRWVGRIAFDRRAKRQ
jgi:hypothetical protein